MESLSQPRQCTQSDSHHPYCPFANRSNRSASPRPIAREGCKTVVVVPALPGHERSANLSNSVEVRSQRFRQAVGRCVDANAPDSAYLGRSSGIVDQREMFGQTFAMRLGRR
eukprot:TRINITY_DN12164_c0_g1_i2.p3 TRINITY_DN12164_c0_g1~~TRINITY_DN12164_c0_g1_i2.p3  ORF type:complete len:112 (+),score=1.69 TRINITY_DN12164_c0_g1_i2:1014-1349(+)